jgi:hypothetical protein
MTVQAEEDKGIGKGESVQCLAGVNRGAKSAPGHQDEHPTLCMPGNLGCPLSSWEDPRAAQP